MTTIETLLEEARAAISAAHHILVVSHLRPDGDAVGSLLGLGLTLQAAGKQVQMVLEDGVPASFSHLPGVEEIKRKAKGVIDLIIVLDCSDTNRIGGVLNGYGTPDINIDHHATNTNFARINLVDTQAVAVAEMLAEYLAYWGFSLPITAGAGLMTGIITDTIGFRTRNVTPKSLRTAANLMELGADMPMLYEQSLASRSFESLQFWGAGLKYIERNGRMVWTILTMDDRRAAGYSGRDDADLINVLTTVRDCDIAMIFVEQGKSQLACTPRL
jgi:bifunctional oligoribonuclease and PAP phosphatase NrnA